MLLPPLWLPRAFVFFDTVDTQLHHCYLKNAATLAVRRCAARRDADTFHPNSCRCFPALASPATETSHGTVWIWCRCHVTVTDVSGNARGMFVCGSMNPWQQNNEHKQRGDKQRRSGQAVFMAVRGDVARRSRVRFKDYIQRQLKSKRLKI